MGKIALVLLMLSYSQLLIGQNAPSIQWQRCLGGSDNETARNILPIEDGGFIIAASSDSDDGDVSGNHGNGDFWIVKLDSMGNISWQKCFGGSGIESAYSIVQTPDHSFVVAGTSSSNDGDVTGNHGADDYWIVKFDSVGNIIWEKSYGGSDSDVAYSIRSTNDGGYIVAGSSGSNDGDVTGHHNGSEVYPDYWVIKLDSVGDLKWEKSLGGSYDDDAYSVQQTFDGGYIVAGATESDDGNVIGMHGCFDYWIVKMDSTGFHQWRKCFGGSSCDYATSIMQTSDDGYVVLGSSASDDGDVSENNGNYDYWLIKLDTAANIEWQNSLGGSKEDAPNGMRRTNDGLILSGSSYSSDVDVTSNNGDADFWIVKSDTAGNLVWQKSMGGSFQDVAFDAHQTIDGGVIVSGRTYSSDGDVSGYHGMMDCWIVKLSNDVSTGISTSVQSLISISPNPAMAFLCINLENQINNPIISVYDLQGRMISLPTSFQNNQAQLNTSILANGFYTLQIVDKITGKSEVGKFVKSQ